MMSHWAKIENGIVTQVTVGSNEDYDEGYQWLVNNLGGTWIQTSYNTIGGVHLLGGIPLRKNYAGIGDLYDPIRDAFIGPKPFDSWVLNEDTCRWEAPIPMPADDIYMWDELSQSWVLPTE